MKKIRLSNTSALLSLFACTLWVLTPHSIRAADPYTNMWVSGINSIYWDGQNVKAVALPISAWSGAPGFGQVSGDPTNYTLWFNAKAYAGISTNPGPTAVGSSEEASPSVEIKANFVTAIDQHAGDTEWNGNGDQPRWGRIRYSDADAGQSDLTQQEWRDGSVWNYFGNINLAGIWNQISDRYYGATNGRVMTTNYNDYGSFSPGMTSEVCSNFFYYTLNYQGDTNNAWHFDFLGRAADTVYRVYSGNATNSSTNAVIINVTGYDAAGYQNTRSLVEPSDEYGWTALGSEFGSTSVSYTRISILINGNTYSVDANGDCLIYLPNDTKTEFKVLVAPDSNGVTWAVLTVSATYSP